MTVRLTFSTTLAIFDATENFHGYFNQFSKYLPNLTYSEWNNCLNRPNTLPILLIKIEFGFRWSYWIELFPRNKSRKKAPFYLRNVNKTGFDFDQGFSGALENQLNKMPIHKRIIFLCFLSFLGEILAGKSKLEIYKETYLKCIKAKVPSGPVFNEMKSEFECKPLLSQNHCFNGEWLVLAKYPRRNILLPECAKKPCDGAWYMIPFGSPQGSCVRIGSSATCEDGEIVLTNVFGYGT